MPSLVLSLHKNGHYLTFYRNGQEVKLTLTGEDWHAHDEERSLAEAKKHFPEEDFQWAGCIRYPRKKDHLPLGNPLENEPTVFSHFDLGWKALKRVGQGAPYLLWTDDWTYALGGGIRDISAFQQADGQYPIWWEENTHHVACLFSGNEQERQIHHLAQHFGVAPEEIVSMPYQQAVVRRLRERFPQVIPTQASTDFLMDCPFVERSLNQFKQVTEAYHQFMLDLVAQQVAAWSKVAHFKTGAQVLVGGRLSTSPHFMHGLAEAFFGQEVYAVTGVSLPEWTLLQPELVWPEIVRYR